MKYLNFLNEVINQGIAGVKLHYPDPDDKIKLNGAIAGFEAGMIQAGNILDVQKLGN